MDEVMVRRLQRAVDALEGLIDKIENLLRTQDDKIKTLEERQLEILADYYRTAPLACSVLCDDILDTSGALLGMVREKVMAQ